MYLDEIVIDFEGENAIPIDSNKARIEKEVEILFNLFVLSDQILMFRIKNLCEFKLSNLVNLKNCIEIYQFSYNYEAKQLNEFCLEFIVNNLITLIESKYIENLDDEMLYQVSKFYCNYFSSVCSRRITPYNDGVDGSSIDLIPLELLYDQKFIDGTYFEDDANFMKKKLANSVKQENDDISNNSNNSVNNEEKLEQTEVIINKKSNDDESFKWEKVKKKVKVSYY